VGYIQRVKLIAALQKIIADNNEIGSTWPREMTPQEAVKAINRLHRSGWERKKFDDPYRVLQAKKYVLMNVPINKINESSVTHPSIVDKYSNSNSAIPPIFFDIAGRIIDGFHRFEAAKMRGDTHILSYVGKGKSGITDPSDFRGLFTLKPKKWI